MDFKLIEQAVVQESLIIHNQNSASAKILIQPDHPYFNKRIVWEIVRSSNVNFYTKDELDALKNALEQPVFINTLELKSLGTYQLVAKQLDIQTCYEFSYSPNINDIIIFSEAYTYKSIKKIYRPERMIHRMTFIYKTGGWELFQKDYRRGLAYKSGVVLV